MKAAHLDVLEKSQLPAAQARDIFEVMESELALRDTALATKTDLHEFELKMEIKFAELRTDIEGMGGRLIRWNFAFWIVQLGAIAGILKLLK